MIVGRPLISVDEVTSTMDLAVRLATTGATSGTTVLAGHQTAGRGRAGRRWETVPRSSILMSFVAHTQRPHNVLGALSLLLGLAVAETVDDFTGEIATIKWPNDLLILGRKIAGILVVSKTSPADRSLVLICGIGLNVNTEASALPETGTSISLASGVPCGVGDVLPTLLDILTTTMNRFEQGDTDELWRRVEARLAFRGEMVSVQDGPRTHRGTLQGVSSTGLLELELSSGEEVTLAAGDLTRGPVAVP